MDMAQRRRVLGAVLEALEVRLWQVAETLSRTLPPDDDDRILLLGFALAGKNDIEAAAGLLVKVARKRPGHAHPCTDFARLCPDGPVAALYRACLRAAPDNARLRRDFAAWLLDRDAPAEAEAVLRPEQNNASAQHLMGLALTEQGKFQEAIPHFQRATILNPIPSMAWANLGMVLKIEGRFAEALSAYDAAVERSPNDAAIRVNRMVALLHAGRWSAAWKDGDWRMRLPDYRGLPTDRLLPPYADVDGRTVLLTHEEGFGDTLQFLRYAPLLSERGAHVVARMPPPLLRIVQRMPGIGKVLPEDAPLPEYDWHCPAVSLPRAFGTTPKTIPPGDYLRVPFATGETRRIGLVWAGQARPWLPGFMGLDARRSAGPEVFARLAEVPDVRFVSLQMGEAAAHPPLGLVLEDPMPGVKDFADTAAIVAGLDLVVSVDTSVVHLAGAMGKPVCMLDRYDSCWRWLHGRSDTPWYPSMTIFRQDRPNDWTEPMGRVVLALKGRFAAAVRPSPARECRDAA
jgi:tetratricopeptide (TPR) repeat protein